MRRAHYDSAAPYIASFMIMRRGNQVAFVLRQNTNYGRGKYGLPAGKVENGEPFSAAAIREAKEEAGVEIDPRDITCKHIVHRKSDDSEWVDAYFEATKWQGEPYNAEPDVHGELTWLDLENLPKNVVAPVRAALKNIEAGQAYSEYGWEDQHE